jgi:hypothetical protein
MPTNLILTPEESRELRDIITNLVLQYRYPGSSQALNGEQLGLLLRGLEQALIDRDCLRQHLQLLRTLWQTDLPVEEVPTDEVAQRQEQEEQCVLDNGLRELPPDRLTRLAIDPVAVLCLRAAIFARKDLPEYWWQQARQLASESQPLKTAEEMLEALGIHGSTAEGKEVDREPANAPEPGGMLVGALSAGPEPGAVPGERTRWTVEFSLRQAEWLRPGAPPEGLADRVVLEMSWYPQRQPRMLEVRFFGALGLSSVQCRCRLVDRAGAAVEGEQHADHLAFSGLSLPPTDLLLECDYRVGDDYHLRFSVPLASRASQ